MVFIDINVLMDIPRRRAGWPASLEVVNRARQSKITGHISALTPPILWFFLKSKGDVRELTKGFTVTPLDEKIIEDSYESAIDDFEDAIQLCSAKRAGCKAIITRNVKHYPADGSIEILTPEDFLKRTESA